MITKEQIMDGIAHGTVKFIVDPNMESGTVCQIGDNWFYFGGMTAEQESPEEYLHNSDMEQNVRCILTVLADFASVGSPAFGDEYRYYEAVLTEMEQDLNALTEQLFRYAKEFHHYEFADSVDDENAAKASIREDVCGNHLESYRAFLEKDVAENRQETALIDAKQILVMIEKWLAVDALYPVIQ